MNEFINEMINDKNLNHYPSMRIATPDNTWSVNSADYTWFGSRERVENVIAPLTASIWNSYSDLLWLTGANFQAQNPSYNGTRYGATKAD
jgi:hypothetical protein